MTQPTGSFSTPTYTAHVGHWSESLVDKAAAQVGGDPDREVLRRLLVQTGSEIDILAGRSFHSVERRAFSIETGGLPFADIPDLRRGSLEGDDDVFEIPDPVNSEMATVLQLAPLLDPLSEVAPVGKALWTAGKLIAEASGTGRLSRDYVIRWLGQTTDHATRQALLRRVMDPDFRFNVPVLATSIDGWWFQITRRLMWVTSETQDEGRLLELLFDEVETHDAQVSPLVAVEAVLVAVPMTSQPATWAFTARIWTEGVRRPIDRPWPMLAKAVHGHGVPTITIDRASTQQEIACQVLLKAYWHGYIGNDEPSLADAITLAFPRQVERVRRWTRAPTQAAAAATLLEGLIHPGFDPARGAEANRRYVSRKASIAVMKHRQSEAPDRYPWTRVGISERRYYKLLPRFARKVNGKYDPVPAEVVTRMKDYLDARDNDRSVRAMTLEVLRKHGFTDAASRKWLQRHAPADAVQAWPRGIHPAR
jgi:hypothetical protein